MNTSMWTLILLIMWPARELIGQEVVAQGDQSDTLYLFFADSTSLEDFDASHVKKVLIDPERKSPYSISSDSLFDAIIESVAIREYNAHDDLDFLLRCEEIDCLFEQWDLENAEIMIDSLIADYEDSPLLHMERYYLRLESLKKRFKLSEDAAKEGRKPHKIDTSIPRPPPRKYFPPSSLIYLLENSTRPEVRATAAYALAQDAMGYGSLRIVAKAESYFEAFLKENPEKYFPVDWLYSEAYLEYSGVLWNIGEKDKFFEILKKAVEKIDPENEITRKAIDEEIHHITSYLVLTRKQKKMLDEITKEWESKR